MPSSGREIETAIDHLREVLDYGDDPVVALDEVATEYNINKELLNRKFEERFISIECYYKEKCNRSIDISICEALEPTGKLAHECRRSQYETAKVEQKIDSLATRYCFRSKQLLATKRSHQRKTEQIRIQLDSAIKEAQQLVESRPK